MDLAAPDSKGVKKYIISVKSDVAAETWRVNTEVLCCMELMVQANDMSDSARLRLHRAGAPTGDCLSKATVIGF